MYGGHQAFYQTEFIIQHFGQRSQAVRGTGSVGDNLHVLVVGVVVYTHNEHRRIGAGRRDNNFLCAAVEVSRSLFGGGEHAGGLYDVLSAAGFPIDVFGIHAVEYDDLFAVYNQLAVLGGYFAVELAVYRVIFEHVHHVIRIDERIVYAYDFDFRFGHRRTEYHTTNTAKPIDTNFHCHNECLLGDFRFLGFEKT